MALSTACSGGGLYTEASLTAANTDFISNTSSLDGGGAYITTDAALTTLQSL